ncbi:MAG: aminoglycoside N3''-acetyltransferase [halophilic archaeon J07HX5]|jgi:Aminoglycoside N3''-acetyltransferase|nr:MAG: aminoglycoside N3''-acetyltransferase [halophilic archaeon J07HX5]
MRESLPGASSREPVTTDSLVRDLRALGVEAGQTLLVHGSLSSLGWVCGGAPAVVDALREVVTPQGTLVMPTHSPGNMDPGDMTMPPVPDEWHETIRDQMPPYRPDMTPTQGMGAIAETFRSYDDVRRSGHPQVSFAAWGDNAETVTADHSFAYSLSEESPLARVYDLNGDVLFLGTDHGMNTSLHLAEYRSTLDFETVTHAGAVLIDGDRQWVEWNEIDYDDGDFQACGDVFEETHPNAVETGAVGIGDAKLFAQRAIVDFAVEWFEVTRE